jgi:hypothetical protein
MNYTDLLTSGMLGDKYVDPRRRITSQLYKSGADTSPIAHPAQGYARLAQTLAGMYGDKMMFDERGRTADAFNRVQPESFRPGDVENDEVLLERFMQDPEAQAWLEQQGGLETFRGTPAKTDMYDAARANQLPGLEGQNLDQHLPESLVSAPADFNPTMQGMGIDETDITESGLPISPDFDPNELFETLRAQSRGPDVSTQRPDIDWKIQQLLAEGNPGSRNLAMQLQMMKMDKQAAAGLKKSDRDYAATVKLGDREFTIAQNKMKNALTREGFAYKPLQTKTENLPGGLKRDGTWNPATKSWDWGETYDPNLKSEAAQEQIIESRAAGRPTWGRGTDASGEPIQISSTGQVKAAPPMRLTVAQKKVDEVYGKHYANFWVTGMAADAIKQLDQLDAVVEKLEYAAGGKFTRERPEINYSGPIMGNMPDAYNEMVNPLAVDLRENIEEVVQRNLRVILGAQFTEKEGIRLIKRAYNPALEESINAPRVARLVRAMRVAMQEQQKARKYYEENGTLKGFKGTEITFADFHAAIEGEELNQQNGSPDTKPLRRRATDGDSVPAPGWEQEDWDELTEPEKAKIKGP